MLRSTRFEVADTVLIQGWSGSVAVLFSGRWQRCACAQPVRNGDPPESLVFSEIAIISMIGKCTFCPGKQP